MNIYVMSKSVLSRQKHMNGEKPIICAHSKCQKQIRVGEKIVSKPSKTGVKRYHEECWESLFLDL